MNRIDLTSLASIDDEFRMLVDEESRLLLNSGRLRFEIDELIEEIEHLGGSDRREIRSRMRVLLAHLLKWEFQPGRRSNRWQATLAEQRNEIAAILRRNPGLSQEPARAVSVVYPAAVLKASSETGLSLDFLPAACPYAIERILDHTFLPGQR